MAEHNYMNIPRSPIKTLADFYSVLGYYGTMQILEMKNEKLNFEKGIGWNRLLFRQQNSRDKNVWPKSRKLYQDRYPIPVVVAIGVGVVVGAFVVPGNFIIKKG